MIREGLTVRARIARCGPAHVLDRRAASLSAASIISVRERQPESPTESVFLWNWSPDEKTANPALSRGAAKAGREAAGRRESDFG